MTVFSSHDFSILSSHKSLWSWFEEDACKIIETTAKGEVDPQLRAMKSIIISYASERFSHIERDNTEPTYTMNHRAAKKHQQQKEL